MIDDDPTQDFWEKNIISWIEWVFIKVSCSRVSLWDLVDGSLQMNDDGLFKYDLCYEMWGIGEIEFWVRLSSFKSFCSLIIFLKQKFLLIQFIQQQNNWKNSNIFGFTHHPTISKHWRNLISLFRRQNWNERDKSQLINSIYLSLANQYGTDVTVSCNFIKCCQIRCESHVMFLFVDERKHNGYSLGPQSWREMT